MTRKTTKAIAFSKLKAGLEDAIAYHRGARQLTVRDRAAPIRRGAQATLGSQETSRGPPRLGRGSTVSRRSSLTLVWWQDAFTRPLPEEIERAAATVDWARSAKDVEFW